MMRKTRDMDMLSGGVFRKVLLFTLPLLFSGLLQAVYNAADLIVVGNFVGDDAVAAVGATVSVYNAIINLFMGLSVGVDVACSYQYGMGNRRGVKEVIDTAIVSCLFVGVAVTAVGFFVSRPLLEMLGTQQAVIDQAALYMRTVFFGVPFTMLYNFCAAVLRTKGDTRHPFYYLTIAGVLNVVLNVVFVAFFGMGVLGVAVATVIAQFVSALLALLQLIRGKDLFSFRLRGLSFSWARLRAIFTVGLLAGIQSSIFSIANSFLQAGVNSLGKEQMAGSSATETLENFVWIALSAFQYAAVTFVSMNVGAGKLDRVKKINRVTVASAAAMGLVGGVGVYLLRRPLLMLFVQGEAALAYGEERVCIVFPLYVFAGVMAILPSTIRGMGHSLSPAVITITGICVVRVAWYLVVFPLSPSLRTLYAIYPISWIITDIALYIDYLVVYRKKKRQFALAAQRQAESAARPQAEKV